MSFAQKQSHCHRSTGAFRAVIVLIVGATLAGCALKTKVTIDESLPALAANCQVDIIMPNDPMPESFRVIGRIETRDGGLTTACSREDNLAALREAACQAGADGVRVVEFTPPSYASTCYRSFGELYVRE